MNTDKHTWCVIMAGGIGSRFWPVSRTDNPKQFIDIVGNGQSMLQMTFSRMEKLCPRQNIVIVTGEQYTDRVREQVPGLLPYQVLAEPLRRNTAPCVAYAAAVISQIDPEATLVVSPADHAIFKTAKFVADIEQAVQTVCQNEWIIILGAEPTRPDTGYGYIQFDDEPSLPDTENLHKVVTFTEKPPIEMARQFIVSGEFYWNAGIFVWQLPVLRRAYERHLPSVAENFFSLGLSTPWQELERVYSQCESISVDNGILEKADNVHVLTASFGWSDVETWGTLYDVALRDNQDNAIFCHNVFTYDTKNCLVVMPNDCGKTVVLEGLDGYIIAASEDTLMICRRTSEEQVFRFASDVELKKLIDK